METEYSPEWSSLSKTIRQQDDYQCQHCRVQLSSHKNLLHVHHKNGVKSDNRRENLLSLCADCHRKQPHHQHMFVPHADTRLISRLRTAQGLVLNHNWSSIYRLADPALQGVVKLLEHYGLPLPDIGLVIGANTLNAQIELAWPRHQIGVAIDRRDATTAKQLGWRVFSMRNVLQNPETLFNAIR